MHNEPTMADLLRRVAAVEARLDTLESSPPPAPEDAAPIPWAGGIDEPRMDWTMDDPPPDGRAGRW